MIILRERNDEQNAVFCNYVSIVMKLFFIFLLTEENKSCNKVFVHSLITKLSSFDKFYINENLFKFLEFNFKKFLRLAFLDVKCISINFEKCTLATRRLSRDPNIKKLGFIEKNLRRQLYLFQRGLTSGEWWSNYRFL